MQMKWCQHKKRQPNAIQVMPAQETSTKCNSSDANTRNLNTMQFKWCQHKKPQHNAIQVMPAQETVGLTRPQLYRLWLTDYSYMIKELLPASAVTVFFLRTSTYMSNYSVYACMYRHNTYSNGVCWHSFLMVHFGSRQQENQKGSSETSSPLFTVR